MENLEVLGSLAIKLNQEFTDLYFLFLPVFFALAILIDWFRHPQGSPEFLDTLKRAIIATLLVVGFQEIASAILSITTAVAERISDMSGLDAVLQMASEKAKSYTLSPMTLVLQFNDLSIAVLTFFSYVVLCFAKVISVALFHFMWAFLCISAPLLILFNLFKGTAHITVNMFKSLIEVASYKVVWAILSAMLTSLSFGNVYAAEGNYLTIAILNFVIAVAMLCTPLIIKSLVGGGLADAAQTLGTAATVVMTGLPAKAAGMASAGREVLSNTSGFAGHMRDKAWGPKPFPYTPQANPTPDPAWSDPLMRPKPYKYPELPPDFKEGPMPKQKPKL